MAPALKAGWEAAGEPEGAAGEEPVAPAPLGIRGVEAGALEETTGVVGTTDEEELLRKSVPCADPISRWIVDIPLVALGHGLGNQRTGHSEGTVGHGDVTGSRDAVGVAAVGDGGGLGAVGGELGDSLSDVGGQGTGGQGSESSDGEAHFERLKSSRNVP